VVRNVLSTVLAHHCSTDDCYHNVIVVAVMIVAVMSAAVMSAAVMICCSDDYLTTMYPGVRLPTTKEKVDLELDDLHACTLDRQCCLLAHSLSTVNLSIYHSVDLSTHCLAVNLICQSNLSIYQSLNLSIFLGSDDCNWWWLLRRWLLQWWLLQ
jgi:hypothetical protein